MLNHCCCCSVVCHFSKHCFLLGKASNCRDIDEHGWLAQWVSKQLHKEWPSGYRNGQVAMEAKFIWHWKDTIDGCWCTFLFSYANTAIANSFPMVQSWPSWSTWFPSAKPSWMLLSDVRPPLQWILAPSLCTSHLWLVFCLPASTGHHGPWL